MVKPRYKDRVRLLLDILPEVAKEACFALHGGTAINLFIRNMPRLSVDIDLTYIPIEERNVSITKIGAALERIGKNIEALFPMGKVQYRLDKGKIDVTMQNAQVKLEVNDVKRGTLLQPESRILCNRAQNEFSSYVEMPVVSLGELYGGKICAALDRQHPRDLFDVKLLLENEGFTDEIRKGFLLCLVSCRGPIDENLLPNFKDQRSAMKNHFEGMSDMSFSYSDFENTREKLVKIILSNLTNEDKNFLLSFDDCNPDWGIHDFERFPGVQWKLLNLERHKSNTPDRYIEQHNALREKLSMNQI